MTDELAIELLPPRTKKIPPASVFFLGIIGCDDVEIGNTIMTTPNDLSTEYKILKKTTYPHDPIETDDDRQKLAGKDRYELTMERTNTHEIIKYFATSYSLFFIRIKLIANDEIA